MSGRRSRESSPWKHQKGAPGGKRSRSASPKKKHRRERREVDPDEEDAEKKFTWGGAVGKVEGTPHPDAHAPPPGEEDGKKKKSVAKPVLEKSGLLRDAALTNEAGVVNMYVASEDSAMPNKKWVLIPLKGEEVLETIPLHRQEWYLIGKDRDVAHIPSDHPSCSRQHAVIQFRRRVKEDEYGERTASVVPYIMDLGSTNGTFLNKIRLEKMRYVELRHKDMLQFASSSRQYILLCENIVEEEKRAAAKSSK